MGSIILEIQADAMNDNVSVQSLLRKAYAVSVKLRIQESKDWIESELNGYKKVDVPDYRKIKGTLRAFNPFSGWIPVQVGDSEFEKIIEVFSFRQSVAEIEELIKKYSDGFYSYFSGPQLKTLQEFTDCDFQFGLKFSSTSLFPIIHYVRNSLLEWALNLEQEGIMGENLSFSPDEVKKVNMSNNFNIHNFQGVLGSVSHSELSQNLTITTIEANDFEQLKEYLIENKVSYEDIEMLKSAIELDGEIREVNQYGKAVSMWIGQMITKAANGSWTVALGAAVNILATGISKYYGLT